MKPMKTLGVLLACCGLFLSGCTEDIFFCTCRVSCNGVTRIVDSVVCADSSDITEAEKTCEERLADECTTSKCNCTCIEAIEECIEF